MHKKKSKPQEQFDYLMKVIIIGDSGVGKSNILLRYSEGKFVDNYMMTIGINYVYKITQIADTAIKMQIWDTAGQDKYKTITQSYYRSSNGVLVVFSLNSLDSFYSVRNWIQDLTQTVTQLTQVILLGNKKDLEEEREVTFEEAQQFAAHHQIPYLECSAKSGHGVQDAFQALGCMMKEKIIDPKIEEPKPKPKEENVHLKNFKNRFRDSCCQN